MKTPMEGIAMNKDMDDKNELEWQSEDGAVIHVVTRRLLGFCDTLQEACETYGEFARIRAVTDIGIPRL